MIRGMVRCKSDRQLAKSCIAWSGRSSDYLIQDIALVGVVVSGIISVVTDGNAIRDTNMCLFCRAADHLISQICLSGPLMHFTTPYEYSDLFFFPIPPRISHILLQADSPPTAGRTKAIINADLSSFKAWEINFSLCCISTLFFFSNLS